MVSSNASGGGWPVMAETVREGDNERWANDVAWQHTGGITGCAVLNMAPTELKREIYIERSTGSHQGLRGDAWWPTMS